MKTKTFLKFMDSRALALLLLLAAIFSVLLPQAEAASVPAVSSNAYFACYTLASSGKVYAYTSSSLTTKTGGYIACSTDECRIIAISGNAVYVSYPVSGGRRTAWFPRSAFTNFDLTSSGFTAVTATGKITTYKRASGSTAYGYIAQGDKVVILGSSGSRTQIIYNVSSHYKMAWIETSQVSKYLTGGTSSGGTSSGVSTAAWQYPISNAYVCGNDWSTYYAPRAAVGRPDHCGIDIKSRTGSTAVCAAADGTIVKSGWNNANGYYVVIQHSLSGKTVYSFYAHLASITRGSGTVQKGTQIGVIGNTGSSSNDVHLHFAVVDKLWAGSYYGYVPSFSGNKVSYSSVTYYNPHYVISNGALPA